MEDSRRLAFFPSRDNSPRSRPDCYYGGSFSSMSLVLMACCVEKVRVIRPFPLQDEVQLLQKAHKHLGFGICLLGLSPSHLSVLFV